MEVTTGNRKRNLHRVPLKKYLKHVTAYLCDDVAIRKSFHFKLTNHGWDSTHGKLIQKKIFQLVSHYAPNPEASV